MPVRVGQVLPRRSLAARLWEKVDRSGGPDACWPFSGYRTEGYGRLRSGPAGTPKVAAHRAAYELLVGPIPDGLQLDHLCRNRACVNPRHLEPVTPRVNTLRGLTPAASNARKTNCVHGHPLSGSNLRAIGHARICRTCERDRVRRHRQRVATSNDRPSKEGAA